MGPPFGFEGGETSMQCWGTFGQNLALQMQLMYGDRLFLLDPWLESAWEAGY
jgi:hypothetical protein